MGFDTIVKNGLVFDGSGAPARLGHLGISAVMSGYLVPLDLFPKAVQQIALVLPFRFLLSFPVELMLGKLTRGGALGLLGAQWAYVAAALLATNLVWRAGLRRYSAYGG